MRASHVGAPSIDTVTGHSYGSTLVGAAASGGHDLATGEKTKRHGRGMRWRVTAIGLDGGRETESFGRKVDAETYADAATTRLANGTYVTEKAGLITVAEVWGQYLSHQKDGGTKARRVSAWSTWVQPRWANHAVRDVQRSAVKAWIVEMQNDAAKATTIENSMEVLRGILSIAVDDKRLADNAAQGHRLPTRTDPPKDLVSVAAAFDTAMESLHRSGKNTAE